MFAHRARICRLDCPRARSVSPQRRASDIACCAAIGKPCDTCGARRPRWSSAWAASRACRRRWPRAIGVPLVLLEQNAVVGRANRRLARLASVLCLGFAPTFDSASNEKLRPPCAAFLTGTPIRGAFASMTPRVGSPKRLVVMGGSSGARLLNQSVPAAISTLGPQLRLADRASDGPDRLPGDRGGISRVGRCGPRDTVSRRSGRDSCECRYCHQQGRGLDLGRAGRAARAADPSPARQCTR